MPGKLLEHEFPKPSEIAPNLLTYTQKVFGQIDSRLRPLAERAIGTPLYPNNQSEFLALAANSFREQLNYLYSEDRDIYDKLRQHGVAALIDSVKQQDVNNSGNRYLGDAYILRNLESIMTFAEDRNLKVILGRYSGDEILAFFIPEGGLSAQTLSEEFTDWNRHFLMQPNPVNDQLQMLLPELQNIHGSSLELGANIQAVELSQCNTPEKETGRERWLLSKVIDGIEGKLPQGVHSLADRLIKTWKTKRTINRENRQEVVWMRDKTPGSIMELYEQAIDQGVHDPQLAAYAQEATHEGLFHRQAIYRMEVFEEIIQALAGREPMVLVKSADPFLKWFNSFVSHSAGDAKMLGIAEFQPPDCNSFQDHGSFIHAVPLSEIRMYEKFMADLIDSQPDTVLDENNQNPAPFVVATTGITTDAGFEYSVVTEDTSPEEIWDYVDALQMQQTANEIAVLVARAGVTPLALDNLVEYLNVRINRLEQAMDELSDSIKSGQIDPDTGAEIEDKLNSLLG